MSDAVPLGQQSFNGGELSLRLHGRRDLAVHATGAKEMLGWLPLVQGPALAAPGTHFVAVAKGPCRLFTFEPNVTQGYAIEASNLAFRFFTNDAPIETAPDTPYEVAHPYSHAELLDLHAAESIDVLYLAGGSRQQATLSRTGAETFAFSVEALRNGPMGQPNADETITVSASATTGSVTLTANTGIFESGHVGAFFELEAKDFGSIKSWEPGMKGITVSSTEVTWAGKVYIATAAADSPAKTGSVPPIHDEGLAWDGQGGQDVNGKGPYGVQWQYLYGRYGLLQITAFISATQVTATVINRLADSLTGTASWRWSHGAFSDAAGWPDSVAMWDECRVFTLDNRVYSSVIGDFDNFERRDSSGDFQRDLAGQFTIPDPARIVWAQADRVLLLGTEKAEYAAERLQIQTGTAGPPVFSIRQQTSHGSKRIKPLQVDGRLAFVQRAGRKLRMMDYQAGNDRYTAADLTRFADHIGLAGFVDAAWQAEPERLAWYVMGDGSLAIIALDPDQQVNGWARRTLGDGLLAKSVCRVTDPAGERDQIWIAAAVSDAEDADWWILRMEKIRETGDAIDDSLYLDAALSYEGDPVEAVTGLDHLEGRTVSILADGKVHPDAVVSGGAVSLEYEASKVHVGLPFAARITLLEPDAGDGQAQGRPKRVAGLRLRLAETAGIRVSVQGGSYVPAETRPNDDEMDSAQPLFSGDLLVHTIGDYDGDGAVTIERYQPLPACLLAAIPIVEIGDAL